MLPLWLALACGLVVILMAASLLERPIKETLRSRWPSFDYDGESMLAWGVAVLGAVMMGVLILQIFTRL